MEKIPISIDKELSDIMPSYLRNREIDLIKIEESLKTKNFATIASIGHRLKGNARSFGLVFLEDVGKKLEYSAQEKDISEIKKIYQEMSEYISTLEIVYH